MSWPIPTPEDQVRFLRNIQRLLSEGRFVASYKYALLLAIADLAVTKGDDSGAPLDLSISDIAERYIKLYWQQCRPYQIGGTGAELILHQNKGPQAEVVSKVVRARQNFGGSLFRFKQIEPRQWSRLLSAVRQVASKDPLHRLQKVGDEYVCFLYDIYEGESKITLKPGVTFCLRAFYELLRDFIQGAWVRFIQEINAAKLGNNTDLGAFMFGQDRGNLNIYRPILRDIQRGQCFYCGQQIGAAGEVDHFIPWARYPTDLGHNFVLAHAGCNNSKSDYLAAEDHLGAWQERNRVHCEELGARFAAAELISDLPASVRIAKWAYEQTEQAGGQVWLAKDMFKHLGPEWRLVLGI